MSRCLSASDATSLHLPQEQAAITNMVSMGFKYLAYKTGKAQYLLDIIEMAYITEISFPMLATGLLSVQCLFST